MPFSFARQYAGLILSHSFRRFLKIKVNQLLVGASSFAVVVLNNASNSVNHVNHVITGFCLCSESLYMLYFSESFECRLAGISQYLCSITRLSIKYPSKEEIVATELKDPICHSLEWQIGSFSSVATRY